MHEFHILCGHAECTPLQLSLDCIAMGILNFIVVVLFFSIVGSNLWLRD